MRNHIYIYIFSFHAFSQVDFGSEGVVIISVAGFFPVGTTLTNNYNSDKKKDTTTTTTKRDVTKRNLFFFAVPRPTRCVYISVYI